MTLSTRHFLVNDDEVRPLTQTVNERLRRGEMRLPQYAGRELHIVDVTVEIENRVPKKLRNIESATVSLDEHGTVRSRLLDDLKASLATARGKTSARWARWSPSKAQIDRITALALGRSKSRLRPPRPPQSARPRRRR